MTHYSELPPPLVGCLYCHTEGTITEFTSRRFARASYPRLVCSNCGSVALYDAGEADHWRISYQRVNHDARYFYAAYVFESAAWLDDDRAIDLSRDAYIQRRRVEQVKSGQLNWLQPELPDDIRPSRLSPDEQILAFVERCGLKRKIEADPDTAPSTHDVDQGPLFLTNRKMHLLGQQREWVYEYAAVINTHFEQLLWRITFSDAHFIEHNATPKELDPQLLTAVVETLRSGGGRVLNQR